MNDKEQQPESIAAYRPFWPSTKRGETFLFWLLGIIGLLSFIRGCVVYDLSLEYLDGNDLGKVFFFYVGLNLLVYFLLFHGVRYLQHRVRTSEAMRAYKERQELNSLRRQLEIRKLRGELRTQEHPESNRPTPPPQPS